jgi:hypothetical protein
MENILELVSFVLASMYPEDDNVNVETWREKDEFKLFFNNLCCNWLYCGNKQHCGLQRSTTQHENRSCSLVLGMMLPPNSVFILFISYRELIKSDCTCNCPFSRTFIKSWNVLHLCYVYPLYFLVLNCYVTVIAYLLPHSTVEWRFIDFPICTVKWGFFRASACTGSNKTGAYEVYCIRKFDPTHCKMYLGNGKWMLTNWPITWTVW